MIYDLGASSYTLDNLRHGCALAVRFTATEQRERITSERHVDVACLRSVDRSIATCVQFSVVRESRPEPSVPD